MSNANNYTDTPVALTTATVEVLPRNATRNGLVLVNNGPGIAYFGLEQDLLAAIPIQVNDGVSFDKTDVPQNTIYAKSASTSGLVVWEA